METIGFALVLLVCMGIAKIINVVGKRLIVNGAAIFLVLAAGFVAWTIYMVWQSDLEPFQRGYAVGRTLAPVLIVSIAAAWFFFKFRADKAQQLRVMKLRRERAENQV